jgi:hypothetical protein
MTVAHVVGGGESRTAAARPFCSPLFTPHKHVIPRNARSALCGTYFERHSDYPSHKARNAIPKSHVITTSLRSVKCGT